MRVGWLLCDDHKAISKKPVSIFVDSARYIYLNLLFCGENVCHANLKYRETCFVQESMKDQYFVHTLLHLSYKYKPLIKDHLS